MSIPTVLQILPRCTLIPKLPFFITFSEIWRCQLTKKTIIHVVTYIYVLVMMKKKNIHVFLTKQCQSIWWHHKMKKWYFPEQSVSTCHTAQHLSTWRWASIALSFWGVQNSPWVLPCSTFVEEVHDEFVGGHDDGGVGDLPDEVRSQPPVEPPVTLLSEDGEQSLEERSVLVPFLP